VYDSVRNYWMTFNEDLEGHTNWMYLDVKGYVSTSVGIKIDETVRELSPPTPEERAASLKQARAIAWRLGAEDGDPASEADIDAEWDRVKAAMDHAQGGGGRGSWFDQTAQLRIDDDEVGRLVWARLDEMERHLRTVSDFAGYDSWPADAQLGLLSMSWAMGPFFADGGRWPNFRAACAGGDWTTASQQCRFNPEIGTIVKRNNRDQRCFLNAATVAPPESGLDPSVLVFPDTA
jgi:hypothetical protein